MSVERRYNEPLVAAQAAREKQMQQHYRPVISVHKWFARRPGALFRALALAELAGRPLASAYTDGHSWPVSASTLSWAVAPPSLKRPGSACGNIP